MTSTPYRHFHEQLTQLEQRLLTMAGRAQELIELSVDALRSRDPGIAQLVIARDAEIDALELEVEEQAIELLALQQPMARDLRFIVAAIKISSDLERVGDHAVNIAQAALRLRDGGSTLVPGPEVDDMARRALAMLGDALDAFIRADGAAGRAVRRRDDEVDALLDTSFRVLLTRMMENPATITAAIQLLLVGRNLERVADLATNIAEDAVYLAEGKTIKHHFEALATRETPAPTPTPTS